MASSNFPSQCYSRIEEKASMDVNVEMQGQTKEEGDLNIVIETDYDYCTPIEPRRNGRERKNETKRNQEQENEGTHGHAK